MDSDESIDDDNSSVTEFMMMGEESKSQKYCQELYPYQVLTPEQILGHMNEVIMELKDIVQIPTTAIRMLLYHFRWDKDKLMERFYGGDQEKLFTEAKIANPFAKAAAPAPKIECQVCLSTPPSSSEWSGLHCGHQICSSCCAKYITTKIMSDGIGQTISCPAHECDIEIDDVTVMSLVSDLEVRKKYLHLITNSFVECNRYLRWCPSPGCCSVIKVTHVESRPVTCRCGYTFCFECLNNWHEPVQCTMLINWIKMLEADSGTSKWISANTKECPKCKASIEKNGGCNHMVCNICDTDFCWACLEVLGTIHHCNRYDESAVSNRESQARAALQRFLFYSNRYMNHKKSLDLEHKLYAAVNDKMEEMVMYTLSWIEVQFMKKAVDVLCQCRRVLMYTYVFAYFLKGNNQSVIFEDNQKDLEAATEMLSAYLERHITKENLVDTKRKLQDTFRYCDSRRQALMDHIDEGRVMGLWEYN